MSYYDARTIPALSGSALSATLTWKSNAHADAVATWWLSSGYAKVGFAHATANCSSSVLGALHCTALHCTAELSTSIVDRPVKVLHFKQI